MANVSKNYVSKHAVFHVDVYAEPESNDALYRDLRLFIGSGSLERVALLLDSGAGVNSRDTAGRTPLMWAAVGGNVPMMRLLIERGAEINAVCGYGGTALMRAAGGGRMETVRFLIEHGADVNAKTQGGVTALMKTQIALHPEGVRAELHKAGATEAEE